ncbi:MAG: hypothetical protein EAZ85_07785, partial [Bacteroidetes bacterium]
LSAQENQDSKKFRIGASFNYGIPAGDFGTINKNGYGTSLTTKYQINKRWTFTQNISFLAFGRAGDDLGKFSQAIGLSKSTADLINLFNDQNPENERIKVPKVNFYMVNVGFEYNILTEKIRPYVGCDVGIYIRDTENIKFDLGKFAALAGQPNFSTLGAIEINGNATNFGIAPAVGCAYFFNSSFNIDLNIKANGIAVPEKKSYATVLSINLGGFYNF